MVLLPISGASLQTGYSGPYVIEKVSDYDYIVATQDHACRNACHIKMLKPYVREGTVSDISHAGEVKVVMELSSAEVSG